VSFIQIDDNIGEVLVWLARLEQLPAVFKSVIDKRMDKIVEDAQADAPVDTGALRDSIREMGVKIQGDLISGEIEAGVDYASFVEKKTGFLSGALRGNIDDLVEDLRKAFEKLMK
jgi:hypothetical protein